MVTIQEAIQVIRDTIQFDLRHRNYSETVELSEFLYKLVSGKKQESLVTQYRERESDEQKAQRVRLTRSMTKYASQQVRNFFGRVRRSDNRKKTIQHESEDSLAIINQQQSNFFAGQSLEDYLFDTVMELTFMDPNSFILFERYDERGERGEILSTKTYPVMVLSEDAINYSYRDGSLEWLIVRMKRYQNVKRVYGGMEQYDTIEMEDFYLYAAGFTIELKQVDDVAGIELQEGQSIFTAKTKYGSQQIQYVQTVYNPGTKEVPAIQVGAYFSQENPAIFTSPLEPAHEVFMDLINLKSEFDLTKALHTFMQKIQYAPPCDFENDMGSCQSGWVGGELCPKCNGTGVEVHKTTQDVILVKWPGSKDEWIPLQDVAHYIELPEWLPKWQAEQLEILLKRISLAVFGTEVFTAPSVGARTATEVMIEWEKVYDKLTPFASKISEMFRKGVRLMAQYLELDEGLTVDHKFPYDFKFETVSDLLAMLQSAKDSGASFEVQDEIERRILEKQYANSPEQMRKIAAKRKFLPFRGKSVEEIAMILSGRAETDTEKVLYESFEAIFAEIENETPDFYLFPYSVQAEVVRRKTEEKASQVRYLTAPQLPTLMPSESVDDEETDIIAPAASEVLNGAQVTAMVNLVQQVASGQLPRSSALVIIQSAFGQTEEQANRILANAGQGFTIDQE